MKRYAETLKFFIAQQAAFSVQKEAIGYPNDGVVMLYE